jgi:hypothetical protein
VAAVQVALTLQQHQVLSTLAVAVAERKVEQILAEQAVQALSFFATPAQFNISLVAQYY